MVGLGLIGRLKTKEKGELRKTETHLENKRKHKVSTSHIIHQQLCATRFEKKLNAIFNNVKSKQKSKLPNFSAVLI